MKRGYFSLWRTLIRPTIHISVGVPGVFDSADRVTCKLLVWFPDGVYLGTDSNEGLIKL